MPFFFILFFVVIVFIIIMANKKLQQRRAALLAEIDGLRAQMETYVEQSRSLDEKTHERVNMARAAVGMKLDQAAMLLKAAAKDRHFDRIGQILALVQTKLSNVQASMGRAQVRADERVQRQADNAQLREAERAQRQAEAAARRTGSFGRTGMSGSARMGSFAPPAQVTDANTAWNTIPLQERGACFFCSRPCMLRELTPVVVPLGGVERRVLACPEDFAAVRSGTIPPIRAFSDNGRPVPWYAYRGYDPYDDYYGNGVHLYVNTYPYSAFDSGYWNFNGGYGVDDGPSYNFSPDTEAYQDYAGSQAAGAMMDGGDHVGGADFDGMGDGDHVGGANFDGMESASDFSAGEAGAAALGADQS